MKNFSLPQAIENSRQLLLLRTDILQKTVFGCPKNIFLIFKNDFSVVQCRSSSRKKCRGKQKTSNTDFFMSSPPRSRPELLGSFFSMKFVWRFVIIDVART